MNPVLMHIFHGNDLNTRFVSLPCRSLEDGGLWSLTLENYIHTNSLAATGNASVRKLYGTAHRLIPYSL